MADKKQTSISGEDFDRLCDTMILLANRGRNNQALVKRIAKAGNVQPVMEYILRFQKMFMKFSAEQPTRHASNDGAPAKRRGSKRKARKARGSEEGASE